MDKVELAEQLYIRGQYITNDDITKDKMLEAIQVLIDNGTWEKEVKPSDVIKHSANFYKSFVVQRWLREKKKPTKKSK